MLGMVFNQCQTDESSHSNPKTRSSMTPPTILEIQITPKRTTPVVTGRARAAAGRKVFLRARRTHLPALGETGSVAVTVRTVESLPGTVLRMAECDSISR